MYLRVAIWLLPVIFMSLLGASSNSYPMDEDYETESISAAEWQYRVKKETDTRKLVALKEESKINEEYVSALAAYCEYCFVDPDTVKRIITEGSQNFKDHPI